MTSYSQLNKMPKSALARRHMRNGGILGFNTYMKWTKEELINAILEFERKKREANYPTGNRDTGGSIS